MPEKIDAVIDALMQDPDAVKFWIEEGEIKHAEVTKEEEKKECRACNTEYTGSYCHECGYDNE